MTQPIGSVNIRRTDNGLIWGESDGSQSVVFINEAFSVTAIELLEEHYGATQVNNGYYRLTLPQIVYLIQKEYPRFKLTSDMRVRMDWHLLEQRVSGLPCYSAQVTELPADFHEILGKALRFMERRYFRQQNLTSPPKKLSPTPKPDPAIPYDLSNLTTTKQKERFEYVYRHRPSIQELKMHFKIPPGTWRQFVHSLNSKLIDCQISYNYEEGRWEVVPVNI